MTAASHPLIDAARSQAVTALAALLRDPRLTERIDRLVHLALRGYGRRYPEVGRRATQPWLFYDGDPTTKRIRGTPERVDVFCLFCRVLLISDAKLDIDYSSRLYKHTTICALRSLAGLMTPGAPGTYRLPSDLDGESNAP